MSFQIARIIFWPKSEESEPRQIQLQCNAVNFIGGRTKSGKSSLLYAIDFCLGSSTCSVAHDLQASIEWFGLLLHTKAGEVLVARRSPSSVASGDSYFVSTGDPDDLPKSLIGNHTEQRMMSLLEKLTGNENNMANSLGRLGSVGFRDTSLLNFQPQHIVANPDTLFYKCDRYPKFAKLKVALPGLLSPALRRTSFAYHRERDLTNQERNLCASAALLLQAAQRRRAEMGLLCLEAIDLEVLVNTARPDETWTTERYYKELSIAREASEVLIDSMLASWDLFGASDEVRSEGLNWVSVYRKVEAHFSVNEANALTQADFHELKRQVSIGSRFDSSKMKQKTSLAQFVNICVLFGRITSYLSQISIDSELEDLRQRLALLRRGNTRSLGHDFNVDIQQIENSLNTSIRRFAAEMQLDDDGRTPCFDLTTLKLEFLGNDNSYEPLSSLGGAQNWLGYHICLMLSLHERFIKNDEGTIPAFLVIDQMSQAFFPDQNQTRNVVNQDQNALHCLERLYDVLNNAVRESVQSLQIIVVDRFLPDSFKLLPNCHLIEEWFVDGAGCVPVKWLAPQTNYATL